jgi:hypothetical protein
MPRPQTGRDTLPHIGYRQVCREDELRSFVPRGGSASRSGSRRYRRRGERSRLRHRAAGTPCRRPNPSVTHSPVSVIGRFCREDEPRSGRQPARQAGQQQRNTAAGASGPACTTGQQTLDAEAPSPGMTHFPTSVIGRFCREDEPRSFGVTGGSASRSGSQRYRHRGGQSRLHHRAADTPRRRPKPRRDTLPRIGLRQFLPRR